LSTDRSDELSAAAADPQRARRAVTVRIGSKDYRLVSDADEGWLQGVATGVDEAMALVRDRTETFDSLDVAVLTALNLARELVLLREQTAPALPAARPARPAPGGSLLDPVRLQALIDLAESALVTGSRD
jgi:cell division protein ZapA (FtsZ GTPase activity inhibitor)